MAADELLKSLNRIWHGKVRDKWKKCLIVKLPKKECKNWRGMTRLPVDSKVTVTIQRIQYGVDSAFRGQVDFQEHSRTNIHPSQHHGTGQWSGHGTGQ